ncbi:hypothetical protein C5Y96_19030 [Blastopirellula marina]|uniref:Peptidase C39 domain-containing protein n=1 Tax=Blastopirellula marina TaxID=124 RepID=A0A2S8F645_9BACT|nr:MULTISPECIES: cysteine peptidase family C39 domain-containing protein [Pirellulaceae]PQO27622.1 hypothetical protein C5Y96_19030 [Blastopirellula marina]RCS48160.1 hypothetical protein DTL36_19060 [Bremerella cremea]
MTFSGPSPQEKVTIACAVCALLFILATNATAQAEESSAKDTLPISSVICGPIAVRQTLMHYGISESLLTLFDEIRPSRSNAGSNLHSISDSLAKRGIHAKAAHIGSEVQIDWDYPVIVHLTGDSSSSGHFVVYLPSKDKGKICQLDGNGRERMADWRTAASERSGVVLLTAPSKPTDWNAAFKPDLQQSWITLSLYAMAATILSLFGIAAFLKKG